MGTPTESISGAEKVFYLLIAQILYFGVVYPIFEPAVPASVVMAAIEMGFAIFFIISGFFLSGCKPSLHWGSREGVSATIQPLRQRSYRGYDSSP